MFIGYLKVTQQQRWENTSIKENEERHLYRNEIIINKTYTYISTPNVTLCIHTYLRIYIYTCKKYVYI